MLCRKHCFVLISRQLKALETELEWADAVVIGPGLQSLIIAKMLVETVLKTAEIPLVIDADALNIISDNMTYLMSIKCLSS